MLRRKQTPITIRSNHAARRLKRLARPGVSQTAIIEQALDRMPLPAESLEDSWRELQIILDSIPKGSIMSMKEFDALEYDENGDLRDR